MMTFVQMYVFVDFGLVLMFCLFVLMFYAVICQFLLYLCISYVVIVAASVYLFISIGINTTFKHKNVTNSIFVQYHWWPPMHNVVSFFQKILGVLESNGLQKLQNKVYMKFLVLI